MAHDEIATIVQQWQRQLDESLEGGEALWLELGVSNRVLDNVQALTALQLLATQRSDVITPALLIGGDGVVWLTTCMSSTVTANATAASVMTLLYGGADRATYMATLATLPGPASPLRHTVLNRVPVGVHSWLWPSSQPGATAQWSTLPFRLTTPTLTAGVHGGGNDGDLGLAWLVLVVVIGLVIAALFI